MDFNAEHATLIANAVVIFAALSIGVVATAVFDRKMLFALMGSPIKLRRVRIRDPVRRKLAAILAADVVGYSRLMECDEAGTLAALTALRKDLIEPRIAEHRGHIVNVVGDGILVEFTSVVEAVQCAVEMQQGLTERSAEVPVHRQIRLRIGINLGDVIVAQDDIHGDGVNVAARLEGLAEPGGICISQQAFDQVATKLDLEYEDLGERHVKNIARPIRVFRVMVENRLPVEGEPANRPAPKLTGKPSIAVLPFVDHSNAPQGSEFSDGITENIITELSRFSDLMVIARSSVFTYKGRDVKLPEVARELGVRYIVEGCVQRSGRKIRVSAQLIDASIDTLVWTNRYDRKLEDYFAVQDEITQQIVAALGGASGAVYRAEMQRLDRNATGNIDALAYYVRGLNRVFKPERDDNRKARQLFEMALRLDPGYARAYAMLAWTHVFDYWFDWSSDAALSLDLAATAAETAVGLDDHEADARLALGAVYYAQGRLERAIAEHEAGIALNPNYGLLRSQLGEILCYMGRAREAIPLIKEAKRLDPLNPQLYLGSLGFAYFVARDYRKAIEALLQRPVKTAWTRLALAACYAQLDREEDAATEIEEVLKLVPAATIRKWVRKEPYQIRADREHWEESLRKSGLPE